MMTVYRRHWLAHSHAVTVHGHGCHWRLLPRHGRRARWRHHHDQFVFILMYRLAADMKLFIHIHIHRFYVDIPGYIHIQRPQMPIQYACRPMYWNPQSADGFY